jgi:uncharacterized protein (DUF849 family)
MIVKVCVNGARGADEHPQLAADTSVLAEEARGAVAAGAAAVHVHPKGLDGQDSLATVAVAAVVEAVRSACPGVPVGVTTGAWAAPNPQQRLAEIRSWSVLPDFASVNWHEDGADAVAQVLLDRGVGVEAGIWHTAGLDAWVASPLRSRCLRVLVELPDIGDVDEVGRRASSLVSAVGRYEPHVPVLLHGEGASAWPALRLAIELGLDTRIGLEDTLVLPDGRVASGNAELVEVAWALIRGGDGRRPGRAG